MFTVFFYFCSQDAIKFGVVQKLLVVSSMRRLEIMADLLCLVIIDMHFPKIIKL